VPREVLVPELPADADAIVTWLEEVRGRRVTLRVPRRGDKRALFDTVKRNALQALAQHKTRRASDLTARSRALQELQDRLSLDEAPLRIECFDVSNLQGTSVVASMVVFEDGLPRKSEYRRFAIRGVPGQDDVAAIHEVVTRRFRRYVEERDRLDETGAAPIDPETGRARKFAYPPNLVVVDGGAPQVAAAASALSELGVTEVALCGLAKRLEEVWLPGDDRPVILPRSSEGLYLLQRVRDEAHRFAIAYHRQKRSRAMTASALDGVPGLGEVRRRALLREFGSVRRLRSATVAEVAEVPGIGLRTAEAIVAALSDPAESVNGEIAEVAP
jgi:excinuclease ABC subunit C